MLFISNIVFFFPVMLFDILNAVEYREDIVAIVVHRAPSYAVMFLSQYPPPDRGNYFCLVVKIHDSGSKGPSFKSTYCHSGDPEEPQIAILVCCKLATNLS
ncbi:hypothetical protein AVEN_42839-1 [Araneus ventricosus]|uniref:Secreted protein n=1 Tax=Araneus ventricosus TaxID=182803 RepID=A0A4Y2AEN9_ARAVE|nr:hypothetical protein AVEN_42839-1 [Araneus ventricosus]